MNYRAARYAPMNLATIPGYPNKIPFVNWQMYLPRFNDEKGDDAAIHLFRFISIYISWEWDGMNIL